MITLVGMFRARSDMSLDEFARYYEERHAPLISELFGQFLVGYRRSYVRHDSVFAPNRPEDSRRPEVGFDVLVEMRFDTAETFAASADLAMRPDVAQRVAQDEERFLDRSSMVTFVVDEHGSSSSESRSAAPSPAERGAGR